MSSWLPHYPRSLKGKDAEVSREKAEQSHAYNPTIRRADVHKTYAEGQSPVLERGFSAQEEPLDSNVNKHASHVTEKSLRLRAWKSFRRQHEDVLRKRVQAEDYRRRARLKREAFAKTATVLAKLMQQSATQQTGIASIADLLTTGLSQLAEIDQQLENCEDDLLHSESAIKQFLPRALGPDSEQAFENLDDDMFLFEAEGAQEIESVISVKEDSSVESPLSPQKPILLVKLDEADMFQEQLMELREDRDQIWQRDREDLNDSDLGFLDHYDTKKNELKASLRQTRLEIEEIRSSQPISRFDDDDLEPASPVPTRLIPQTISQDLQDWLEKSTDPSVFG